MAERLIFDPVTGELIPAASAKGDQQNSTSAKKTRALEAYGRIQSQSRNKAHQPAREGLKEALKSGNSARIQEALHWLSRQSGIPPSIKVELVPLLFKENKEWRQIVITILKKSGWVAQCNKRAVEFLKEGGNPDNCLRFLDCLEELAEAAREGVPADGQLRRGRPGQRCSWSCRRIHGTGPGRGRRLYNRGHWRG